MRSASLLWRRADAGLGDGRAGAGAAVASHFDHHLRVVGQRTFGQGEAEARGLGQLRGEGLFGEDADLAEFGAVAVRRAQGYDQRGMAAFRWREGGYRDDELRRGGAARRGLDHRVQQRGAAGGCLGGYGHGGHQQCQKWYGHRSVLQPPPLALAFLRKQESRVTSVTPGTLGSCVRRSTGEQTLVALAADSRAWTLKRAQGHDRIGGGAWPPILSSRPDLSTR